MSSLQLTADILNGSPQAGQIEFNGVIYTATPTNGKRGLLPTEQFYRLDSDLVGTNVATAQNLLGVGVTLDAGTVYEFEFPILLSKAAGATSHTISLGFGGTATLNNIAYNIVGIRSTATASVEVGTFTGALITTAAATTITNAIASATEFCYYMVKGTVSVNAGGTFIPQYTLSVAPGGAYSTKAGSYMKIKPIGPAGANTSIGAWA